MNSRDKRRKTAKIRARAEQARLEGLTSKPLGPQFEGADFGTCKLCQGPIVMLDNNRVCFICWTLRVMEEVFIDNANYSTNGG